MRALSENERQRSLNLEAQSFRRAKRERNFLDLMSNWSETQPFRRAKRERNFLSISALRERRSMKNDPKLLAEILDHSPQTVHVTNEDDLMVMYANKAAVDYSGRYGITDENVHCHEFFLGLKEQCSFCPLRTIGDQEEREVEIDNGREIYALKLKRIKWQGTNAFIEYARDITEIRKMQINYEKQVRVLLSSFPEAAGIFHMDITEDCVLSVNGSSDAVKKELHLETVDDTVRWTVSFIPSKEEGEEFFAYCNRDAMLRAHEAGETELVREEMSYFDDGSIRPAKITCRMIVNPNNDHLECVMFGMDISKECAEREQHTLMIEEKLLIFNAMARNFKNVYLVDMNKGLAKVLKFEDEHNDNGLDRVIDREFYFEQFLDAWIDRAVHPDDRQMLKEALSIEHLRDVFAVQNEYMGNYRMLVDGKIITYQFNLYEPRGDGYIIAGFQNVEGIIQKHLEEERKRHEIEKAYQKKLVEAKREAERANRVKTEFLQHMSHDIRTPINGIRGMIEIAEHYPDNIKKQTECREKVKEASGLLLELINEVLDMSKLESGEIVFEYEPFDIIKLSREVYDVIERLASERGIEIIQSDCHVPHRHLMGSPVHYKRVLMNILSNAVKYNKDKGKIFITCQEIASKDGKATVEFVCRDTGIGMSEDFQKHLFEPFAQEAADVRTNYKGTGLGMPITKSIVEKMGGTITFESVKGEGTTFRVVTTFDIDQNIIEQETVAGKENTSSIEGAIIILAEDNELNMEISRFLLTEEGARVIEVRNGQEAVDAMAASEPGSVDAILMDIMMPVIDGYEATRAIRQMDQSDAKSIPIIAMTANAFMEDKLAAKKAGMDAHIAKPLDTKQLMRTLAELIAK